MVPDQAARAWLAPEEVELQDVERAMEEELIQQHMAADRVIAARSEPDGSVRYLVKVRHYFGCVGFAWRQGMACSHAYLPGRRGRTMQCQTQGCTCAADV